MLFRLFCLVLSVCFVLSNAESDPIELLRKKMNSNQDYMPGSIGGSSEIKTFMGDKLLQSKSDKAVIPNVFTNQVNGFDEKLDDNKYLIGTGDGFTVYLWGTLNSQINSVVNIEGELVLQDVGAVNVKGKSLRECKDIIKKKIFEQYKSIDVTIVLSKIRDFKVYVLGEIVEPGAYVVNGSTRVSDVLQLSGGVNDTALLRNIVITNASNATENSADMVLFYHNNDISKNPYINEGDRVFVKKTKDVMRIDGAVNYPGNYDYLQGDSIGTLIKIAGGFSRGADSNRIIVKRFVNNIDSLITITCSISDINGPSFKLNADDRIIISFFPDYRVFRNVTIKGEVNYPGVYPIQKDKTKLSELIGMAGGLTSDANLKESKIRRKVDTNSGKREYERLMKFPTSQITPLEASYLIARSNNDDGYFSLDLEGIEKSGSEVNNFILRNGDEVIINSRNLSIKVIGGVATPGLVEYKSGADAHYYIQKAGGFSYHANRTSIKIIKSGSEKWRDERDVKEIVQGDVIWVPEKGYKNYFNLSKEILVILGSVATIIISAFTINNFL